MVARTCEACGNQFLAKPCHVRDGKARCCSKECANSFQRRNQIERACECCSTIFRVPPSTIKKGGGVYCSKACHAKSQASTLLERFNRHIGETTEAGCILWKGATCRGYGTLTQKSGGPTRANRIAYELFVGPIPDGLNVLHRCDNPRCVNPEHLFLGTPKENTHDMIAKGRQAKGRTHGISKLTDDAVRSIRERYAAGGVTQDALASEHNVTQSIIWRVIHRKGWMHVA